MQNYDERLKHINEQSSRYWPDISIGTCCIFCDNFQTSSISFRTIKSISHSDLEYTLTEDGIMYFDPNEAFCKYGHCFIKVGDFLLKTYNDYKNDNGSDFDTVFMFFDGTMFIIYENFFSFEPSNIEKHKQNYRSIIVEI